MRALSISAAWDEAKAILTRDGRLFVSVALALIALPAAVNTLLSPAGGVNGSAAPAWIAIVTLVTSLIALAGQLSLIRLALGPSITVGAAIAHGLRRMPIYLLVIILLAIALFVLFIPFGVVLALLGVPITATNMKIQMSAGTSIAFLVYFVICAFFAVRFIMSAPVASAEEVGPIGILKRSWTLTAGHWWPLFGFLAMFIVGAIIVLIAVGSAVGVVVRLAFGSVEPMSAAALIVALIQSLVSAAVSGLFALMLARIYVQLAGNAEQMGEVFS